MTETDQVRAAAVAPSAGQHDTLQAIAQGVTLLAGFAVAAVSVVRGGDTLEVLAVSGSDDARDQLLHRRTPIALLRNELAKADDWGLFKFVPAERVDAAELGEWAWIPDMGELADPAAGAATAAWHPLDLLCAPLHDDAGELRGLLSIDLPLDGRRPGPEQRAVLEMYAAQAGRAVVVALEREALAERVRLADAAREAVRQASAQRHLDQLLEECRPALVEGFGALGLWIQVFDEHGPGMGTVLAQGGADVHLTPDLVAIAEASAQQAWREQRSYVVAPEVPGPDGLVGRERELVLGFLESIGVGSILFVPLGAGRECVGNLVLTRAADGSVEPWTAVESDVALDVGHDLGRAILNARTSEKELRLIGELQALDDYKTKLIATVAHELKNPLTSVLGHLEMLDGDPEISDRVQRSLAAMQRGARRLGRVVDDLLMLAKAGDPEHPVIARPVDLVALVTDVLEINAVAADQKRIELRIEAPDRPVVAMGEPDELDKVATNLVSNAIKYTPEDRTVTVRLGARGGQVVLECVDEGIGISPADQSRLFHEFFRSTNPAAVAQPGTGLGLAIVARIVARHGGRVEVESELGAGSTFRVTLPAAGAGR